MPETEDMDRERAETHLRQLAEAELRRATASGVRDLGWHATNHYAPRPLGDNGEVTLDLAIVPPLEAGTRWVDVVAAGPSAEVRARLPLRRTRNP